MAARPNILFLLNDHQAYYRHGWDGGPIVRRPYFDQLASEGVSFNRCYCPSPLCGPVRRSLLTGLYPHAHGETKNNVDAPFAQETLPEMLARAGYRNYHFGKWHAGPGTAMDHACEGYCPPGYANPYITPEYDEYLKKYNLPPALHLIEQTYEPATNLKGEPNPMHAGWIGRFLKNNLQENCCGLTLTPKETHEAFFLAQLACDQLMKIASQKNSEPFCMQVHFWGPHQPFFPTWEYASQYNPDDIPEYGNFADDLSTKPEHYRMEQCPPLSEKKRLIVPNPLPWSEWARTLARVYAHITMVDDAGGMILNRLEELGLTQNTLVIWTTDHGDAVACHGGHFNKQSYMPEEMVRVPLAIRYPGEIQEGATSEALVDLLDVPATILQAGGTSFPDPIHGESLLPLCRGEQKHWRKDMLIETHGMGPNDSHVGRLVVNERYKYVWNPGEIEELYDLQEDPYELKNLWNDPTHQSLLEHMRERLKYWQESTNDPIRM